MGLLRSESRRPLDFSREGESPEEFSGIQIVLAGLIHYPNQTVRFCVGVGQHLVQFPSLSDAP